MSRGRMSQIVSIAQRHNLHIIEDECYPATLSDAPSLRALAPERVWYMGSLSKTLSAALRFGYVVCPTGLGDAGRLTAQHSYFALSRLTSLQGLFLLGINDMAYKLHPDVFRFDQELLAMSAEAGERRSRVHKIQGALFATE